MNLIKILWLIDDCRWDPTMCSESEISHIGFSCGVLLIFVFLTWTYKSINCEAENLLWRLLCRLQQTVFDFTLDGKHSSSDATEGQSNSIYVNIHTLPSSPPPLPDTAPHSKWSSNCEHDVNMVHTRMSNISTIKCLQILN